jgi:predicted nucleic acid-binding protein
MTRILLDTSGYAAFRRGRDEVCSLIQRADEICLTPVVLGELLAGFFLGAHRQRNQRDLAIFLASERVAILRVDEDTAERYAVILTGLRNAGTPIPTNDIWIAASAMQHGLRVVTTDAHFQRVPQVLTDLFPPA